MQSQLEIVFISQSPINVESFNQQLKDIFFHLFSARSIDRYEAGRLYKIGSLHSRISEIAKELRKYGIEIERKKIVALNYFNQETLVNQYWLSEESITKLKSLLEVKQAA